MFKFNPKMRFLKKPISIRWNILFRGNVSDFYRYFTAKNLNLCALISLQKVKTYYHFFMMKLTCFLMLFNIFEYEKI